MLQTLHLVGYQLTSIRTNHTSRSLAAKNRMTTSYIIQNEDVRSNQIQLYTANTDYIRQAQVMNIDNIRLIKLLMKIKLVSCYNIN